ncbi:hypothetical protein [Haloferula sp. BvORR071]|uniref:hypothetical protein n=1 Tax=Haloferula sp. BvORR071 TaxID=1396141 RepID=UPI002240F383|nr:hypothetical protein [Haloferula sp. BvORR071]
MDDAARAELIAMLKADPVLRKEAIQQLRLSAALEHLPGAADDERFVRVVTEHVFQLGNEKEDAFVAKVIAQVPARRKNHRRPLAVAALVLVSAVAGLLIAKPGQKSPVLARLVAIDNQGRIISTQEVHQGFKQDAKEGLYRLDFNNGAVVAIEGPAKFEVVSAAVMRLASGKLNAWCPETAHGFQVLTANAKVTDLGTSFGVSTSADGHTDFVVLDGLIDVSQGSVTRRVAKGEALRTAGSGLHPVAFQTNTFSRTWPLASGILSSSGSVKPAPPGTAEQLALLEDDSSVLVIPERRSVPFKKPLEVELAAPGDISLEHMPRRQTLPAQPGLRLRSFLIRYNPVGRPTDGFRRFEGEVTFDRPVLAICASGAVLEASDPTFATGPWSPADGEIEYRGIDLDQPESRADRVTLSEDRKTVSIIFNAGASTDDLRVIVTEGDGAAL